MQSPKDDDRYGEMDMAKIESGVLGGNTINNSVDGNVV